MRRAKATGRGIAATKYFFWCPLLLFSFHSRANHVWNRNFFSTEIPIHLGVLFTRKFGYDLVMNKLLKTAFDAVGALSEEEQAEIARMLLQRSGQWRGAGRNLDPAHLPGILKGWLRPTAGSS